MKVFLLGFMGVGKTTIGKQLAKLMNYSFFDTDFEIEKFTQKSISELFEEDGEDFFRTKETEILMSFLTIPDAIISVGGGTPCFNNNMQWMNENGITIFLNADPAFIYHRLIHAKKPRPLINFFSPDELKEFIELKLQEREFYYQQSKILQLLPLKNVEELLDKLIDHN